MKLSRGVLPLVIGLAPAHSFFVTPNGRSRYALLYSSSFDTLAHPSELASSGQLLGKLKEKRILLEELKESREQSLLKKLREKQDVIEDFDFPMVSTQEKEVLVKSEDTAAGSEVELELELAVEEKSEPVVEEEPLLFFAADPGPISKVETEPVVEEAPAVADEVTAIQEEAPIVAEEAPEDAEEVEEVTAVEEEATAVEEEAPIVAEVTALEEEVTIVEEEVTAVEEEVTAVAEEETTVGEEVTAVEEEAPEIANEAPEIADNVPETAKVSAPVTQKFFEDIETDDTETPQRAVSSAFEKSLDSSTFLEEYFNLESLDEVRSVFPDALNNKELLSFVSKTLGEKYGYTKRNTLLATSFDCDEVNRPFEENLREVYGDNFNMGGLAGFPFGGATSFGAMAAHIPDGGSCLVVYGPNVGVDSTGKIGTVERRGRRDGGSCLSSAVAASRYIDSVLNGEAEKATVSDDPLDAQQYFVGSMLMPYAERLDNAKDKMLELPYVLYDAQTDLMDRIVEKSGGAVANGKTAVLGGIQINTPPGYTDYFLPLSFKVYNDQGKQIDNLLETPFPLAESIFPGALSNAELVNKITSTLEEKGYEKETSLVATSLCCDEVNRPLEDALCGVYGTNYDIGNLVDSPFGETPGFGAIAANVPDGGSCLVVYGPHIGVDSTGKIGTVERRGQAEGRTCFGSVVAAFRDVDSVLNGQVTAYETYPHDSFRSILMPYSERLDNAKDKMLELPYVLYDAQTDLMDRIVENSSGAIKEGKTAVLGGIQINTPPGYTDYFLPLSFKLYNKEGKEIEDLLWN